jgi:hypothetical protein
MPVAKNKKNQLPPASPPTPKRRGIRKPVESDDDVVVGIWKERYPDETPVEIGRRLRREPWTV